MLLFALLLLSPACSLAFSWPRRNKIVEKIGNPQIQNEDLSNIDGLINDDDSVLLRLNLDALQIYSQKPDCFKKAASLIRTRCTDLDMDEEARVNAAISMTLCDMATAKHYSLPLECVPYSQDVAYAGKGISRLVQGECVDSLARSAQFWSSYSGYLRELPQLCHAFRRGNDIDLARNIYYNVTVEKISLIRFILDKERKSERFTEEWIQRSKEMQHVAFEMKLFSGIYQATTDNLIAQLNDEVNGTLTTLRARVLDLFNQRERVEANALADFGFALDSNLQRHINGLETLLASAESTFAYHLDSLLARHVASYEQANDVAMEIQRRWMELGNDFKNMKQDIIQLSGHATEISNTLALAVDGAADIRAIQFEASLSAIDLVKSVVRLTDTAHMELDKINKSTYAIQQNLLIHNESVNQPWKAPLMSVLGYIYRADPGSLGSLERLTSFRLLLSVVGFGWTVFREIFSVMMGMVMVLFFVTQKYVMRKLAKVLSSVFNQSASLPLSIQEREQQPTPGHNRPVLLRLYDNGNSLPSRKRVSRIPDRLCSPSSI